MVLERDHAVDPSCVGTPRRDVCIGDRSHDANKIAVLLSSNQVLTGRLIDRSIDRLIDYGSISWFVGWVVG